MCFIVGPATADDSGEKAPTTAELISGKPHELPIKGMVTMVDIGAHACIPCKMMTPVIEELSKKYDGRAAVAFIDVWEHREEAAKYGIRTIPTQIFYDAQGNERYRHVGFLDKASIEAKFSELGVK
ncbi:thioredoxin family protein [Desulfovibrio sp. JC022]|nr:thioredoxin family protein [Desulfovibrio sp. JC022]